MSTSEHDGVPEAAPGSPSGPDDDHDHDHDHGHGHSHGHGHGLGGGWERWLSVPALQVTLLAVGLAAVATAVGLVALWPDGSGRDAATAGADELGLLTEQLAATLESLEDGLCSYSTPDNRQHCRTMTFIVHDGPEAGALVVLPEANLESAAQLPDLAVGDEVFLGYEPSTNFYFYLDRDRGSTLIWLGVAFVAVVIALSRVRGILALAAMAVTIAVLVGFVAPSVIDGNDPLAVAVVAASAIAFISLYLTHGLNPTTTVALAGTLAALGLTFGISWLFFDLAEFTGFASEEGLILPLIADFDVSSLLLGGAVLGALGALDDVTVTQVATVAELRRRNPSLSVTELIASGIRVGREHIASTVNTLLLAYAGASMPLLLLFAASNRSLGRVANSEVVAVEIVRTLCGSIGLVAAVPLTTVLAAVLVAGGAGGAGGGTEPASGPSRSSTGDGAAVTSAPPSPEASPLATPAGSAAPRPASAETGPEARPPARWDDFGPPEEAGW